ncbi:MAG TPA: Fe-S cluster assembly protein HesB, partial [candidate division Zixibacteria bacterium]|nr:Fe-S cluster assembly protein HesB [candidate division Zixibacteria bacterium]
MTGRHSDLSAAHIAAFRRDIRAFYRRHGRHLPFRETNDPYAITVAEIMLQQTTVERVTPYYEAWLRRFPDWQTVAAAPIRAVLAAWSGLGYNRRALYLQKLAQTVVGEYGGELPSDPAVLRRLPGIGPYTANAVAAFAFGRRVAAVDTNVRKVLLHRFGLAADARPAEIQRIAELVLPRTGIRAWHAALMDYARLGLPPRESRR